MLTLTQIIQDRTFFLKFAHCLPPSHILVLQLSINHVLIKKLFRIMSHLGLPFQDITNPFHLLSQDLFSNAFHHLCCLSLQSFQFFHIPLNSGDQHKTQSSHSDYNLTNSQHGEIIASPPSFIFLHTSQYHMCFSQYHLTNLHAR